MNFWTAKNLFSSEKKLQALVTQDFSANELSFFTVILNCSESGCRKHITKKTIWCVVTFLGVESAWLTKVGKVRSFGRMNLTKTDLMKLLGRFLSRGYAAKFQKTDYGPVVVVKCGSGVMNRFRLTVQKATDTKVSLIVDVNKKLSTVSSQAYQQQPIVQTIKFQDGIQRFLKTTLFSQHSKDLLSGQDFVFTKTRSNSVHITIIESD